MCPRTTPECVLLEIWLHRPWVAIAAIAVCFLFYFFCLLALIHSQLKVVLDEVATSQDEVNFRVNTNSPVFTEILGLMRKCDMNTIHCTKTKALCKWWAKLRRCIPFLMLCTLWYNMMPSNGMVQELTMGGCCYDCLSFPLNPCVSFFTIDSSSLTLDSSWRILSYSSHFTMTHPCWLMVSPCTI